MARQNPEVVSTCLRAKVLIPLIWDSFLCLQTINQTLDLSSIWCLLGSGTSVEDSGIMVCLCSFILLPFVSYVAILASSQRQKPKSQKCWFTPRSGYVSFESTCSEQWACTWSPDWGKKIPLLCVNRWSVNSSSLSWDPDVFRRALVLLVILYKHHHLVSGLISNLLKLMFTAPQGAAGLVGLQGVGE